MSKVFIPKEERRGEQRVAATPETVRRLAARGFALNVQQGAGEAAGYADADYAAAGATVVHELEEAWGGSDAVLCVNAPIAEALELLKPGALLAGLLSPYGARPLVETLKQRRVSAFALELLPRISRAQSMDVLSSQANVAGYKAVLLAASALDRYMPMLMTAAGTIQPARALILGAGVAGLQALATARRLGAVVYVSDVRAAAKEQVESLGGRFLAPPDQGELPAEAGGYAKAATEQFLAAQRQQLAEQLALADLVICTALVPGRRAPLLIDEAMLDGMRPGSVVVDLAVAQGGNCACTVSATTVERNGVLLIGGDGLPSSVANHASALYARNLAALLEHLVLSSLAQAVPGAGAPADVKTPDQQGIPPASLALNLEDPIVAGCLLTHAGECLRPDILLGDSGIGTKEESIKVVVEVSS